MRIMPETDYWLSKLNIHFDQIEKQFFLNKESENERLAKKWDRRICELIVKEVSFDGTALDGNDSLVEKLIEVYPKEARQFIYLTEFARGKRRDAVLSVAEEKLHPELLQSIELEGREPNAKDILWLIFELFCQEPEALFDVYLQDIEKKHSSGTWFQLLSDDRFIKPRELVKIFEKDSIQHALTNIDVPHSIECPKVIDREDTKVLFIDAEGMPKTLKLRNSRNQGYADNWIIVRLDKKNKRVQIAAKNLEIGTKLVRDLISNLLGVGCTLVNEDHKTPGMNVKKFINVLLKEKKDSNELIEIELDNAPIEGIATKIRLKRHSSIAKPVTGLNYHYYWLRKVSDMERIQYVKIKHGNTKFKLKFDWLDESPLSVFVRLDNSRVDSSFQEEFKQYMKDNYEINICSG